MKNPLKKITHYILDNLFIFLLTGLVAIAGWFYLTAPKENVPIATYLVGYDEEWYPLHLLDKRDAINAFSNDIVQAIADQQNITLELTPVRGTDLFSGLEEELYNGFLSSLDLHEDNEQNYTTSDIYYPVGPICIVSKSSNIESLNDLKGKTIGIITGFASELPLKKFQAINFTFYDYNNRFQMIDDVSNNIIDGMIMNMIPASEFIKVYPNKLRIIYPPLTHNGLKLISKKDPESEKLIQRFNEGLKAIKKNGIYDQLVLKWGLLDFSKKNRDPSG